MEIFSESLVFGSFPGRSSDHFGHSIRRFAELVSEVLHPEAVLLNPRYDEEFARSRQLTILPAGTEFLHFDSDQLCSENHKHVGLQGWPPVRPLLLPLSTPTNRSFRILVFSPWRSPEPPPGKVTRFFSAPWLLDRTPQ